MYLNLFNKVTDALKLLPEEAEKVFAKRIKGESVTQAESEIFKGYFTYFLFKLYAKYNIATELHVGAMRNNNTQMLKKLGLDTGYDSIAEDNSIKYMSRLFDRLDSENALPKTIVFNLNPKMNSEIMTLKVYTLYHISYIIC